MQESNLNVKDKNIERVIDLCAKGRYGEAGELLMNGGFQNSIYMSRNPITEALHEWKTENACIKGGVDCCFDCGPCLGACCGLPLFGLCCITVFDGGDIAQKVIGGGCNFFGDICEKICCSCFSCL